ncbi:hypothetical protein [Agromyces badenianii]|uniref:hypothetical protein n=1 Tax=Agromyces badenianii TaxID=2080742 RepID=UPI00196ADBE7|nr:hypothetical protein [Agromyces badenianii]
MSERVHKITSMKPDGPNESRPEDAGAPSAGAGTTSSGDGSGPPRAHGMERGIDRVLAIQRPVVVAHLRSIRRRSPAASPEQIVRILERRYLAAVTTGGAAVGATAVIPGIGTGVTLALSGVETAGFLEATALFAQSVAEVHGIPVESPDRARALVMTLMLGSEGVDLVRQFAGQASGTGVARNVYWGELITNSMPKAVMGTVVERLRSVFIRQFAVRGGAGIIGKAIPFGIGAAIGGAGNHMLGRRVLKHSRLAFGQPPAVLPLELEPREGGSVLESATARISRVGGALGTAARATGRGIGEAGRAITGAATRKRSIASRDASAPPPADTDPTP